MGSPPDHPNLKTRTPVFSNGSDLRASEGKARRRKRRGGGGAVVGDGAPRAKAMARGRRARERGGGRGKECHALRGFKAPIERISADLMGEERGK